MSRSYTIMAAASEALELFSANIQSMLYVAESVRE